MVSITTTKANILANFAGQGAVLAAGIITLPIYLGLLGVDNYAVVAFFSVIQMFLAVLDRGVTPGITRAVALSASGSLDVVSVRGLLARVSAGLIVLGASAVLCVVLVVERMPSELRSSDAGRILEAVPVMVAIAALRLLEQPFRAVLQGLQRQVVLNIVIASGVLLRVLSALMAMVAFGATPEVFFASQLVAALPPVLVLCALAYRLLSPPGGRASSGGAVRMRDFVSFSTATLLTAVTALGVTVSDRIALAGRVPLEILAGYSIALVLSSALSMLALPIVQVYFPRMVYQVGRGLDGRIGLEFHHGAQLVAAAMCVPSVVVVLNGEDVLAAWTRSLSVAQEAAPLLLPLVLATLLNALTWMPYQLSLAVGRAYLVLICQLILLGPYVVLLLFAVNEYGAAGAAWALVGFQSVLLVAVAPLVLLIVDRRLMWPWLARDLLMPIVGTCVLGGVGFASVQALDVPGVSFAATLISAGLGCVLSVRICRRWLFRKLIPGGLR